MINESILPEILNRALDGGGDFAEIFVEETVRNQLHLTGQKIEQAVSGRDWGAGIRIFLQHQALYAYTNDLSKKGLMSTAKSISQVAQKEKSSLPLNFVRMRIPDRHPASINPEKILPGEKIRIMLKADKLARSVDRLISQVEVTYLDEVQQVLIANSQGVLARDKRTRTRLFIMVIASNNGEKQVGSAGPGAMHGYEFMRELDVEAWVNKAAQTASAMIRAQYAPGGQMPVIIQRGFGGVIFHEACGHALEATAIAQKASIFQDKMGQPIASPILSAVDDGTIPHEWGSSNIDDEGTATERTLLIEKGILKSYMVDLLSGQKLGLNSTGSGRRQSYKFPPVARMRNSFILPGNSTLEEMIAETSYGLLAKQMGGGSVNPATGDFNFAVQEGYLIEKGKIGQAVRGATLIGNGAKVLHDIDMIGHQLELAQGMCGAASGMVPVNVGQPDLRVKSLIVGGR
ncbi:MAG: TldD/PmbA family protein [Candidatus Tectomicrobia bacterium]|uniref:TldD/PmbA family protein n=1 Tax=Tectimicrobiota bacterium TaxID=2528274 RepID=A0A933GMP6_UNCTE|nr:TldD/PmbA family protein [Candidatus Tectomicrobia bacterium]